MIREEIIQYYDKCESDYRLLWDLDHSHAMHAGFWDENTRTLRDALRRENEVLAEIAQITAEDRVLDAGCGVGGSSIFLAKYYACQVDAITLSEKQVKTATHKAEAAGVDSNVTFSVMDYTSTTFSDKSFDVVWGVESICHAQNKGAFIKEAARVLKPGGRLIVADGFATHVNNKGKEHYLMQRWLRGWGVSALETVESFENELIKENFEEITFRDITQNVWPSAKRLYLYSLPAIVLSKMGECAGFRTKAQTENLQSARCQYEALKKKLWLYGIFCAVKR
ncbi:MAG: methyltransferase domain-containing protein [Parachlamydiaceae bacterium]|nr:methyltransferase domain-containing protein [Parachlamydiaceae bacterium]